MTTLQKTLVAAVLAAAFGTGIYQAHQASKLRDLVQTLQQQQASLNEQVRQLKKEDEETKHQFAAIRDKPQPAARSKTAAASPSAASDVIPSDMLEAELERAYAEPTPGRREIALRNISRSIASDDIPRALAFLVKRPGMNGVQSPLFADLASKWGPNDPNAASAWANALTDPDARKAALVGILKGWTDKAPEAAATYAATLSPEDVQEAAVMQVIGEWAFWHADGAANWVAQFPEGKLRDKAMGPVVFWGQGQCPATIADMLDATGSTEVIQRYGESVAAIWLQRDEPAARTWIEHSPLSDEIKQRLLKPKE